MELFIYIIATIILVETSYLVAVNTKTLKRSGAKQRIFVDTSVLIDGRIIEVAKSGFLMGIISIPRSVIGELQYLADNADSEKRTRARHGLDVVSELQAMKGLRVEIFQDGSVADEGVDERLLNLAKKHSGVVCTIDYNLNKVAKVENIGVLNVNDLAMGLRMAYLPGEKAPIHLLQKGQDSHQAIGHLDDGTMVVVENGNSLIGQTVEVEFIRGLQTAAGKMMFARLINQPDKLLRNKTMPKQNNGQKQSHSKKQAPRKKAYVQSKNKTKTKTNKANTAFDQGLVDLINHQ